MSTPKHELIQQANQAAFQRLLDADPVLVDVLPAREVIPEMKGRTVLHAGPPIEREQLCPPLRSGILGGILYEGWANKLEDAEAQLNSGAITLDACHEHQAVGSMAGITTPSMWVYVVEERRSGARAYSSVYEGRGKTLAFGCNGSETLDRLHWMNNTLGPALNRAVKTFENGLPLKPIMARAIHMGDECHNRHVAATLWFMDELTKSLSLLNISGREIGAILRFMTDGHYNSFLTLAMAGCKAVADAAHGIPHSTLVTAMARNGTEFGIRVSGLGEQWFTAPAQKVEGLYFPGHDASEANPDLGDSTITETVGLGGFALLAAPVTMQVVGKGQEEAVRLEYEMSEITFGRHDTFTLPYRDFLGTPTGIDILKVVETNITPICVTAISSIHPNTGMIGAGIVRQPAECFQKALRAFAQQLHAAT